MWSRSTGLKAARAVLLVALVAGAAGVVWARCSPGYEARYRGKRLFRVRKLDLPLRMLALLGVVQAMLWPATRRWVQARLAGVGRLSAKPWAIWVVAAALVALFVWGKVSQHRALGTHASDFGLIDGCLTNCLRGDPFYAPVLGRHYFSQHYMPFYYVLVLLYRVWDTPYVLLVVQGAAVALAVVPLYYLIRRHFPEPHVPMVLALAWLTCKPMGDGLFFDFHSEMLEPLFLFTALWLLDRLLAGAGRPWPNRVGLFACVLAAISMKEDVPIYLLGMAFYAAVFARRWRLGAAIAGLCLVCGYLMVVVAVRHYAASEGGHLQFVDRYAKYGSTNAEIALAMVTKPWLWIADLARSGFPRLLVMLLLLPLLAPFRLAVLGLLPVLPCAMSSWGRQAALSHYWAVPVLPYLIYVALAGLERLCRRWPRSRALILDTVCLLAAAVNLGHHQFYRVLPRHKVGHEVAQSIPADASVAAQCDLLSHVARRGRGHTRQLYVLKHTADAQPVDYALFDLRGNTFPLPVPGMPGYDAVHRSFDESPDYECIVEREGFKLFRCKQARNSAPSRPEGG